MGTPDDEKRDDRFTIEPPASGDREKYDIHEFNEDQPRQKKTGSGIHAIGSQSKQKIEAVYLADLFRNTNNGAIPTFLQVLKTDFQVDCFSSTGNIPIPVISHDLNTLISPDFNEVVKLQNDGYILLYVPIGDQTIELHLTAENFRNLAINREKFLALIAIARLKATGEQEKMNLVEQIYREAGETKHSINNVLTSLNGSADLLNLIKNDVQPNQIGELTHEIRQASELIAELAKLHLPTLSEALHEVHGTVCIEDLINNLTRGLDKKVQFNCAVYHSDVIGSKENLHHILFDLIENAIKYSGDRIKEHPVIIYLSNQKSNLLITIKNAGVTVDEDETETVLQGFRSRNAQHIPGTGTGLKSAHTRISKLGGRIAITPNEIDGQKEGAIVRVYLPTRKITEENEE